MRLGFSLFGQSRQGRHAVSPTFQGGVLGPTNPQSPGGTAQMGAIEHAWSLIATVLHLALLRHNREKCRVLGFFSRLGAGSPLPPASAGGFMGQNALQKPASAGLLDSASATRLGDVAK